MAQALNAIFESLQLCCKLWTVLTQDTHVLKQLGGCGLHEDTTTIQMTWLKYAHNLVTVLGLQSIHVELEIAEDLVKCDFFKIDP